MGSTAGVVLRLIAARTNRGKATTYEIFDIMRLLAACWLLLPLLASPAEPRRWLFPNRYPGGTWPDSYGMAPRPAPDAYGLLPRLIRDLAAQSRFQGGGFQPRGCRANNVRGHRQKQQVCRLPQL